MEKLSGADMLIRALQDEGVEYVFGYPGGAVLHIYDALFNQEKIKHILVRHEQGATHMADGYARATGRTGVVLVTSGPGATNAITGIATAYMDSSPMVVISGQVQSHLIGTDSFQETDMIGVSRPVVKHSFLVKEARDIPETIKKAFFIARSPFLFIHHSFNACAFLPSPPLPIVTAGTCFENGILELVEPEPKVGFPPR